jgi:predicted lipoprotein
MTTKSLTTAALLPLLLGAACLSLGGCKIEHKSEQKAQKTASIAGNFETRAFNPKAEVEAMWDSRVLPTLSKMALDYTALKQAISANIDAAGAQHGNRTEVEGAPWTMVTRIKGKVVAVESELSAGTADVDTDGDGKADVQIQIGPVIKGTAIRDALPFIAFSSYTNQIDFAQLANALNERALAATLASADRKALNNLQIDAIGVFAADTADDLPLVTLVAFKAVGP